MPYELLNMESSITGIFFTIALLGYISKTFYDFGYFKGGYKTIQNKSGLNQFFTHIAWGIGTISIIAFVASAVIISLMYILKMNPPNELIPIIWIITLIALVGLVSILAGIGMQSSVLRCKHTIVNINTLDDKIIRAIEIYNEDEIFLHYLNEEGNCCSIRKEIIDNITEAKRDNTSKDKVPKVKM